MASNCRLLSATLVLLLTLDHSQAFLRSYRNSRTWGTGRQGRRLTNNRARVGRQQLDVENDLSGISPVRQCGQCSSSDTETGVVCGTDGKNYQNLCQLKQISCKFLRRQGSTKLHRNGHDKQQKTVFRQGRTLLDQGCPNFDEIFFGASVHEKIEI